MGLFVQPTVRATDADGVPLPGALLYFYTSGGLVAANTYTDSARAVPHANPVVADAGGLFAPIYLDPAIAYRAILKTAGGTTIQDIDPVSPAVFTFDGSGNATAPAGLTVTTDLTVGDDATVGGDLAVTGALDVNGATTLADVTAEDATVTTLTASGTATAASLAVTGALTTAGGSGLGYATGAGGTVTQLTSKSTGVTLDKTCGQITLHNAALAANTTVSFTLTNSKLAAGDVLVLNHISGGTAGSYALNAQCGAGTASVNVRNITAGSLGEAIVIAFAVVKAVTA